MITTPYIPVPESEQKRLLNELKMSVKYDTFNTFTDIPNIDDKIMDLSPEDFSLLSTGFPDRMAFFDAVTKAENYISNGQEVPPDLYNSIQNARNKYKAMYHTK